MSDVEQHVRDGLARAMAGVQIQPPPLADLLRPPARWPLRRRVVAVAGVAALLAAGGTAAAVTGALDPVGRIFDSFHDDSAGKQGIPPVPADHVATETVRLPDGAQVVLWVTDPRRVTAAAGRCFFVERIEGGQRRGGTGSCGGLAAPVSLNPLLGVIVGADAPLAAHSATVTNDQTGQAAVAPVTTGYFLVPPAVSGPAESTYTITFRDSAGRRLTVAAGLTAGPPR
jgi:hypothetical protein